METVKVSSKGQIVIPKSLRESHHIQTGDVLMVSSFQGELRLKPIPPAPEISLESVAGMLQKPGRKKLSDAELDEGIGDQLLEDDLATRTG